jgi:hypothetical protein
MPSPRKYHPHGSVLFVTLSLEAGLLLLANPLCQAIVKSCLARAQFLHPGKICHFLFEATHLHLLMVVDNPDDVSDFIGRFKTESAHMLNRVLGRLKRTVWCEGYDSPVVLSPLRALIAITYLYANPAKDNLIDSISGYPGLSSWGMFNSGERTKTWTRLRRRAFGALARDSHNLRGYTKEAQRVLCTSKTPQRFCLEPNAWLEAFGITDPTEQAQWNARLKERLLVLERRAREKRNRMNRRPMGREKLLAQLLDKYYEPKRSGRRMWCLSEDRKLRIEFISHLKELIAKAKEVYQRWFVGDFSEPYPLGLYPPSMPKLAEPVDLS